MKLTAASLFLVLAPSLCAQGMHRGGPVQNTDPAAPILDWIESSQIRPAPVMRVPQPVKPISVKELLIPAKAVKELQRSEKAFYGGDLRASREHLEKAVHIYPDFFEAHYNLGTNYVRLHEYEKAFTEYQTAMAINSNLPQAHHGLAVSLYFLGRYSEAEASARRALELNPESIDYRYMVGRAIIAQGLFTPETRQFLLDSQEKFPNASLLLAQIFVSQGKIDDAVTELQTYLRSPDPDNKEKAECWLALLNGVASGTCAAQKTFPDFR